MSDKIMRYGRSTDLKKPTLKMIKALLGKENLNHIFGKKEELLK